MLEQRHHDALLEMRRRLFGYACALSPDIASAEDLYQDAILRAMTARKVPDDATAFRVWMFRVLRNLWIDRLRAAGRLPELTQEEQLDGPAQQMPDDIVVNRLAVRQAFMTLSKPHRDVLALVDIAGFSYAETAEILDTPTGTIMSRVSRARSILAQRLSADDKIIPMPRNRQARG